MTRTEAAHRIADALTLDFRAPEPWTYKVAALVEGDELDYLDAVRDGRETPWRGVQTSTDDPARPDTDARSTTALGAVFPSLIDDLDEPQQPGQL
jgi:hypothetical protein